MNKDYHQFEKIRLYAMLSYIFMSFIYISITPLTMPFSSADYRHFYVFFITFIFAIVYNLIRYRYFNTVKYNSELVFFIYGCFDLFVLNYYFGVPSLDQGGKIVAMFILIIANIYRGRKTGIILTLAWFPFKIFSYIFFEQVVVNNGKHGFQIAMTIPNIIDSLYFQIMLLILVFITDVIYRQILNKEKENEHLLNELGEKYKELNIAHDEIEAKNENLKKINTDLESANEKLAYGISEFFTLQQVTKAIGSILDVNELMKFVNDITIGIMGVKDSSIILFNEKLQKLEVQATNIEDAKAYNILSNNINSEFFLNVLERGEPICENAVDSNQFVFTIDRNIKSFMCIPITVKDRKFGLILVEQEFENAFGDDKLRLLTIIGQQVGMTMENADLYQKMRELALRDNLTGVYNRMYFTQRLEEGLIAAQVDREELTVAMFDIDHFKKFNDTHGHLFGDKVLKKIAEIVKDFIRDSDVFARFGGEEFIIMLPQTSLDEAYEIIENLRKKIAGTLVEDNGLSASVTVSFGIACYPQNAFNITELLKNVDDALYDAKESGRNCVKVSLVEK